MLKQTSLSQLIQAGREVGSRLEFLIGLQTILFDRQIKRRLLEPRRLHRILAHETWIVEEEWTLTGDDERLTAVLKKFRARLSARRSSLPRWTLFCARTAGCDSRLGARAAAPDER